MPGMLKRLLMLGLAVMAVAGVVVAFGFFREENVVERGSLLRVGTHAAFSPYSFTQDGEIRGFDIDLIRELALRLGREIELVPMPFEALLPAAVSGEVEVVAAGMSQTPTREREAHFSRAYLRNDPLVIVSSKGPRVYRKVAELMGKEVIVNEGYTADLYMSEIPGVDLVRVGDICEGFTFLKEGRGVAFVTSASVWDDIVVWEGEAAARFTTTIIPGAYDSYSLLVSPRHAYLVQPINAILDQMDDDGFIELLRKKWSL